MKNIYKILIFVILLIASPCIALATQITVPSASGPNFVLISTSTGAYITTATSTLGFSPYPFFLPGNATSTPLMILASTTIGNGTLGLTNNGNSTTTGTAYFAGKVGIGTTSPTNILQVTPGDGTGVGFFMNGQSKDGSTDYTGGVDIVLTHNGAGNRQFAIGNSETKTGIRIIGGAGFTDLDGYDWNLNNNQPLNIDPNGSGVGIRDTSPGVELSVVGNSAIGYASGQTAPANSLIVNSKVGVGTTTPGTLLGIQGAANFDAGSSTIYSGLVVPVIAATSTTASSTFANGINLTKGCFSVLGVCVGSGSGSGVVGSGTTGQYPYYAANGTTLTATSAIFLATNGIVGIGTVTPGGDGGVLPTAFLTNSVNTNKGVGIGYNNATDEGYVYAVNHGVAWQNLVLAPFGGSVRIGDGGGLMIKNGGIQSVRTDAGSAFDLTNNSDANFDVSVSVVGATDKKVILGSTIANDISFVTNANEKLRIMSGGNIGVGTSSPWAKLSVSSANAATQIPLFAVSTSSAAVGTTTPFLINALGNVGIGTINPLALLSVNGTASTTNLTISGIQSCSGSNALTTSATGVVSCGAISGGAGTVNSGLTGQNAYYAANGTAVSASSTIFTATNSFVGISTTTPWARFSVGDSSGSGQPLFAIGTSSPGVTGTTTALVLDKSGNLGVGTSTPNSALAVNGSALIHGSITQDTTASSTFSSAASIFKGRILQIGSGLNYVPTGGANPSYLIIDRKDVAQDASVLLSTNGKLGWEIGTPGDGDLHWKSITGTESGGYTFLDRLYMSSSTGAVGYGTSVPTGAMEVATSAPSSLAQLTITNKNAGAGNTGAGLALLSQSSGNTYYLRTDAGANGNKNVTLNDGSFCQGLYLDSANNVGIQDGCTNISGKVLTVGGDAVLSGNTQNANGDVLSAQSSYIVATSTKDSNYTDVQSAINALPSTGGLIHVRCGTYTLPSGNVGIAPKVSNTVIEGEGNCTQFNFDKANTNNAVEPNISNLTGLVFRNFYIHQTNGTFGGIGINASNTPLLKVENIKIDSTATSTQIKDTLNLSFYQNYNHLDLRDNTSCVDIGGNPVNDNTFTDIRCSPHSGNKGYALYLDSSSANGAQNNTFTNFDSEPTGAGTNITGIYANNAVSNYFINPYVEGNGVGYNFTTNSQTNIIHGGIFLSNTSYTASGSNNQYTVRQEGIAVNQIMASSTIQEVTGNDATVNDLSFRGNNNFAKTGNLIDMVFANSTDSGAGLHIVNPGTGPSIYIQSGNSGFGTSSPYATVSIQSGIGTVNTDAFIIATSSTAAIGGYDNDGHRFTSGPAPKVSSCGTGSPTVVGDDQGGTITTGTAATSCTITFSKAYRKTPYCTETDNSSTIPGDVSSVSTTALTFSLGAGLSGGNIYYQCTYHQ